MTVRYSSSTPEGKDSDNTTKENSNKKIPMQGQFKNPIVGKLWAMRHDAKERLGLDDDGSTSTTQVTQAAAAALLEPKICENKTSKTPLESSTAISYPFSTDEFLLESYR